MENKNTLNGFEAILESLNPNVGANKTKEIDNIDNSFCFRCSQYLTYWQTEFLIVYLLCYR